MERNRPARLALSLWGEQRAVFDLGNGGLDGNLTLGDALRQGLDRETHSLTFRDRYVVSSGQETRQVTAESTLSAIEQLFAQNEQAQELIVHLGEQARGGEPWARN